MNTLIDFIEAMQERNGLAVTYRRICEAMVVYLQLFSSSLPPVAQSALKIVAQFHHGEASAADLEAARVKCWELLDENSASSDFSEPQTCAVRAVICVLYASPPSDDISELFSWFLNLMEKSGATTLNSVEFFTDYFSRFSD